MYHVEHISRNKTLLTTFSYHEKNDNNSSVTTHIDIVTGNGDKEEHAARITKVVDCLQSSPLVSINRRVSQGNVNAFCTGLVRECNLKIEAHFVRGDDERVKAPYFEELFEKVWFSDAFKQFVTEEI